MKLLVPLKVFFFFFWYQQKYVHDLLSETGHLGAHPADTPMDSTVKHDGKVNYLVMLVDTAAWLGS